MRRSVVITRILIGGFVVGLLAVVGAPASAQAEDLGAFCNARVDLEHALLLASGHGDEDASGGEDQHGGDDSHGFQSDEKPADAPSAEDAARILESAAPAAIADDAARVAKAVIDKGDAAFEQKAILAAAERIDAFVLASCGFPRVDVHAIDYEFTGTPEILPTGSVVFQLANDAPKEEHELVVLRVNDDVKTSAKKLVALSEKKLVKKAELVAAAFAPAGESGVAIGRLEPGRYVVYCSIPVGGKEHGKPHWKEGMIAELRAEDGS